MDMFGELLAPVLDSAIFQTISLALGLAFLLFAVALVFWMYRDARRRGTFAVAWGVLGVVGIVVGVIMGFSNNSWGFIAVGGIAFFLVLAILLVYTILRPAEFEADARERELSQRLLEAELETNACPSCGAGIEVDYLICPTCNVTLRRPCDYCGRPIKTDWATCPYCLSSKGQAETRASAPSAAAASSARKSASKSTRGASSSSSGSSSSSRGKSGSSADPATRRRSSSAAVAHPPHIEDDADDLDLDFEKPARSSSSRSSSSGRKRTSSGSGRHSHGASKSSGTSTFKD